MQLSGRFVKISSLLFYGEDSPGARITVATATSSSPGDFNTALDTNTYIQTDIHTDRQTDRHTYIQTDRQKDRQTNRQPDSQTITKSER